MFSFSKRECDKLAGNMMSLDLTDDTEKALIKKIFESAIACLNAVSSGGEDWQCRLRAKHCRLTCFLHATHTSTPALSLHTFSYLLLPIP